MGRVAWELYHLDCFRQWPEMPEVTINRPHQTLDGSSGNYKVKAQAQKTKTATTACSQVFAIAELAEEIFLQLNQSELLCGAQQVCRQWHMIINTTRTIREHLFLDSISDIQPWLVKYDRFPVLSTKLPHSWAEDENLGVPRTILENPFLPLLSSDHDWPEPFTRAGASWRTMLLTQPGVSRVFFHLDQDCGAVEDEISPQGTTMGHAAERGPVPKLRGWSAWTAYQDPIQLKTVKAEMRLSRHRLREAHEWSDAEELPEYQIWEEKTGESLVLDL